MLFPLFHLNCVWLNGYVISGLLPTGWLAAGGDSVRFIYKMAVVVTDDAVASAAVWAPLPLTDLLRVPARVSPDSE